MLKHRSSLGNHNHPFLMMTQDQGSMIRFHSVTHCFVLVCRTFTLQPNSEQGFFLISLLQSMTPFVLSQSQKSEIQTQPMSFCYRKRYQLTVDSNTPGLILHSMLFSQSPFITLKSYNVLHQTKL